MNSLYISNNVFLVFLFCMVDTQGNFDMDIFFLFPVLLKTKGSLTFIMHAYSALNNIKDLLGVFKNGYPESFPHISREMPSAGSQYIL